MAITAQYVIKEAQTALQDLAGIRWPASELVTYLNDGQRDLIVARPDANSVTVTFATVSGVRQSLPAAAMSLIDVPRNTTGRALRKADSDDLDAIAPNWRSAAGVTSFVHFCYDPREPNIFLLYPPSAITGGSVELSYAAYPTDVSAPTGDGRAFGTVSGGLTVNDQWASTLLNYVLFRAYSKDAEYGGNVALATAYYQAFANQLGSQLQSSQAVAPQK
jgi:hypothetical protein